MANGTASANGGIGFGGLLAIIFITLKLIDKIDWSWVWVLAPLWMPAAAIIVIIAICLIMALITGQLK